MPAILGENFIRLFEMRLKLIILSFFCAICRFGYAQIIAIEGKVTDAQSHQPVPFATLGIKGKNIGTVADENGVYHFKANAGTVATDDPLIISLIGYTAVTIPFGKFKQGLPEITLVPIPTALNTVTIKPDKFKTKVFGRTGDGMIKTTTQMFIERYQVDDHLGRELAAILTIDKHCYLREFNLLVLMNSFENAKFRLNFYSVKNDQPDQLIVNKDILFDVQKTNWSTGKGNWLKVDLTKYNIYLEGYKEIAVAIQWVKGVKNDTTVRPSFGVSAAPAPFHAFYQRYKSQAEWKKTPSVYLAFNIVADSFKPRKEKDNQEEDREADETAELSDGVKKFVAAEEFDQEAEASGYGNNSVLGKYIHLSDANIYYEVYGSGEPLLLLHGNGASISSFYKQIPELAKHYQVIAVDTRAQGKSTDASTTPLTYEKFAEDMKLLLDSLNIKQTNIVGWSDGGNTGLIMAIKYPAYVHKLVTMGAVLSPDGVEPNVLKVLQNSFKNISASSPAKTTHERLVTLLVNEPHISDSDLHQIQAPVLVIAGEKDVVLPEHTKEIAANIRHSKLLIIDGATHYAPWEKPVEFNQAVLDFFKQRPVIDKRNLHCLLYICYWHLRKNASA